MPIQAPQWTDYLNCPACSREFSPRRGPVSLSCGHTLCRPCLKNLIRKQCPFDQSVISMDLEELVVNTALLQLMGYDPPAQPFHPLSIQNLPEQDRWAYDVIVKSLEQLAVFLKYCCTASVNMIGNRLSRPMQRKLVTLLQCALLDDEGRGKAARAARSLGERTVSELILQHQNPQQLSANLWAAVRSRGCQFLGPAMQEEVLRLVLLALEDGSPLSRKVLVMFVVQRLEPHFPQASKTSIGHVVQLLYRASCFMVSKRESDSSLMQLKEEFRTYECLRREHDAQIVHIATESGLRIAPDQWSALLYGDTLHKSHMQSIIDKLQTPHSFAQAVQELFLVLQRTGDPGQLLLMSMSLDRLTNIDPNPDAISPTWQELSQIITALKEVVSGLVDYMQHHSAARDANHNLKMDRSPDATSQPSSTASFSGRYKVAMCRDTQNRMACRRGDSCTYAHSEEELERYRRRRQENPNTTHILYPTSPLPIAPPSMMPRPVLVHPTQNDYSGMSSFCPTATQLSYLESSPAGRQHGMPNNGDMTDEIRLEHARQTPNPPDRPRTYANALVYGAAHNRQRQNHVTQTPITAQNGSMSPLELTGGIRQPNGAMSPGGGINNPGGTNTQENTHNRASPLDYSTHNLGGGMHPPANGAIIHPVNGGVLPPVNGYPPVDQIVFPPFNGGLVLINGRIVPFNWGVFPVIGGIVTLLPNGGRMLPFEIENYSGNIVPYQDENHENAELPPQNHQPPTDSRYFPRTQTSDPQNNCAQMGGAGVPPIEEIRAEEPEYLHLPEFIPRQYGSAEAQSDSSYGLAETQSQIEDAWQPLPLPPAAAARRTMFEFTNNVKNLPQGINQNDHLPMGVNITRRQESSMFLESQPSTSNYEIIDHITMPTVSDMADREANDDSITGTDYTELATSLWLANQNQIRDEDAVLADLHQLAVRVTTLGSDNETD